MISRRLSRRLVRHHVPLGLLTLASAAALYGTRSYPDILTRLSFASAWPALVLIAVTLLVGPVREWLGRGPVVSLDLRRDIGIWAGIVGLFHAGIGQCVHLRGRPWLYYIYDDWAKEHIQPIRHDMFGFANFTGLIAALVLLALVATSNDASLRKLGSPGWKKLQRWSYACFGLTAAHTFAYQLGIEKPIPAFVALAVISVLVTLLVQARGYARRSRER